MKVENNKQMNLRIRNGVSNLKYSILDNINSFINTQDINNFDIDNLNYQVFIRLVVIRYLEINKIHIGNIKLFDGKSKDIKKTFVDICNACKNIFPFLFGHIEEKYINAIFSSLMVDILDKFICDLPDEYFLNNVEVIGWMHQAYVGENRTKYRQEKILNKTHVPTLSQVFTPKWIVKYMVENSLGKIYYDNYLNYSNIKLKYYLNYCNDLGDKYKINSIKDISIIEPCVGTGHILVYTYELLFHMYIERGYQKEEISKLIFENNITGLDIDQRAIQISRFCLMIKAWELDNNYFNNITYPKIYEIKESKEVFSNKDQLKYLETNLPKKTIDVIKYIKETFKNGKILGSLLKIKKYDYLAIVKEIENISEINLEYFNDLIELLFVCDCLSRKYDIMITNPPYLGISTLGDVIKFYALKHYPDSRSDMFAMFMETDFVKENGYMAMINMHTWMFISSYKNLRLKLIKEKTLINMVHTGAYTFEGLSDTALATAFVYQNKVNESQKSLFVRLAEIYSFENKKIEFFNKDNYYYVDVNDFIKVPGYPYIYFVDERAIDLFEKEKKIKDIFPLKQGMATGDNETFVRYWHEVNYKDIKFDSESIEDAIKSGYKWFPYNKGGNYRKWYGMNEYVISFDEDSYNKLLNQGNKLPSRQYYFKKGITWSLFGFENFGVRYKGKGFLFDVSGSSMFPDDKYLYYVLAFLCSNVAFKLLSCLAPTVNFQVGNIGDLPIIIDEDKLDIVNKYAKKCIELCKKDWDKKETSWDYKDNSIYNLYKDNKDLSLKELFNLYKEENDKDYYLLKDIEEKINEIFIDIYKLKDMVNKTVIDRDMSIKLFDENKEIRNLLSYLAKLILTNNNEVISITNGDLKSKIICLVKELFGEKYFNENIKYLNETLNVLASAEDEYSKINRYLVNNFYNDHIKMYQKRPIYIMYNSGKKGAFRALSYYHTFNYNAIKEVKRMVKEEINKLSKIPSSSNKQLLQELIDYKEKLNKIPKDIKFDINKGIKANLLMIKDIIYPFE